MRATLSPGLWFCAPQMMVRSALPSLTLQTESLSEPGTLSRVRICATTMPSNSPGRFTTPSTSRPSRVKRSASSSGVHGKSTYCLSQLSVTFIKSSGEHVAYRRADQRKRGAIILAQQRADGRGDLAVGVRLGVGAFARGRGVGADDREPVAFRVGDFLAVTFPILRTAAAAVVGGNDERRLVAVLRDGLRRFPQAPHEIIHVMGRGEVVIIAAGVGPFIGLAKADKHESGPLAFQVIVDGVKEERIVREI